MLELENATFEKEITNHEGFAVVDFYTKVCGPCRITAPIFTASESKFPEVKHAKIQPDNAHDVFVKFDVSYVPTFILFKDGKEIDRKGFMSEKDMNDWLAEKAK